MSDSHLGDSIFGSPGGGEQEGPARHDGPGPEGPARHDGRNADPTGPVPPPPLADAPASTSHDEGREHQTDEIARLESGPARPPSTSGGRDRRGQGTIRSHRPDERRRGPAVRGCLALIIGGLIAGAALIFAISSLGSSFLPHFGGSAGSSGGDYVGQGADSVVITVSPGDSGAAIGASLQKAGVVKSASTFTALAAADSKFARLQPGRYRMRTRMSSANALTLLLAPTSKISGGVTIPEGLWASEIYLRLSKATKVPLADYRKVPVARLGLPTAAKGHVEGYLYPSTYNFPKGASAQTQLTTMVSRFKQEIVTLKIPAARLARVTNVASLVQAEASRPEDTGKVARVIDNRLAKKMPLQFDSTVNYVLQRRGKVTTSDKARESSSPYNTYRQPGLPPGPIDNPGAAALKAALNPTPGSWIYFVTVNLATGETKFATTDTEHNANVQQFRAWCSAHPGKC